MKFDILMQNDMPNTAIWSESQPGENSNMADVRFPKPEVAISQPLTDISTKFGLQIYTGFCKSVTGWLVGWLVSNGTFSTKKLYHAGRV